MQKNTTNNNGRFKSGISGNPSGRPPGSQNKSTLLIQSLLEGDAEELTRKVIEQAKAGEPHAMRLCMDRLMPPLRDRSVVFNLPPIQGLTDISLAMKHIVEAISDGILTPQEGETISLILERHVTIMVNQDLQERVEKIERGPAVSENKVEIVRSYR